MVMLKLLKFLLIDWWWIPLKWVVVPFLFLFAVIRFVGRLFNSGQTEETRKLREELKKENE